MDLLELWFFFFRPQGLRTRRPAQTGPGGQNLGFPRFDPMILCSIFATIRWTTLENHSSKHMMVYDQITLKNRNFTIFVLIEKSICWLNNWFLDLKTQNTHGKNMGKPGKSSNKSGKDISTTANFQTGLTSFGWRGNVLDFWLWCKGFVRARHLIRCCALTRVSNVSNDSDASDVSIDSDSWRPPTSKKWTFYKKSIFIFPVSFLGGSKITISIFFRFDFLLFELFLFGEGSGSKTQSKN